MNKTKKLAQQLIAALLFVAALVLIGWLSNQHKLELDWTAGHVNTLTQASRRQLSLMKEPIKFIAFLPAGTEAEARTNIKDLIGRYQRFKSDISLEWVDPAADPAKVRAYNIEQPGEVVVEYGGRHEPLLSMSESVITGALQRLTATGDHYIVFLQGHGEHSIDAAGQDSYQALVRSIRDKGLKVEGLNLVKNPSIPMNTSALVLANPTSALLPGELKIIVDYVNAGGNLLWMNDPEAPPIDPLAKALGIAWQNGFVVFPNFKALGLDNPATYISTAYPENSPVTRDIQQVTAFPFVRSVSSLKDSGWNWMLVTEESAWLETGASTGDLSFDPASGDLPGPLTIGATLTRAGKSSTAPASASSSAGAAGQPPAKTAEQRVIVVGDSDFLTDANLAVGGNRELALDILQWLASNDAQLDIDVPKSPDINLYIPGTTLLGLIVFFLLLLPVGLIAFGLGRWIIRRRA
jgi:ABC-type uncharacterized transport system involved in gliding motility auxiliary subunit